MEDSHSRAVKQRLGHLRQICKTRGDSLPSKRSHLSFFAAVDKAAGRSLVHVLEPPRRKEEEYRAFLKARAINALLTSESLAPPIGAGARTSAGHVTFDAAAGAFSFEILGSRGLSAGQLQIVLKQLKGDLGLRSFRIIDGGEVLTDEGDDHGQADDRADDLHRAVQELSETDLIPSPTTRSARSSRPWTPSSCWGRTSMATSSRPPRPS